MFVTCRKPGNALKRFMEGQENMSLNRDKKLLHPSHKVKEANIRGKSRQKIIQVRTGKASKCDRSGVNKKSVRL